MRVKALRIVVALLLVPLAACNGMETAPGPSGLIGGVTPTGEVAPWPFWPRELRIHPLTRLAAPASDGAALALMEVRVEFRDAHDHTTRCYGQILIELYDASHGAGAEPVIEWNDDLRDIAANTIKFDPVTRTYLLRLEFERARLPEHAELRAFFLSVDGAELRATHRLRTP